MAGPEASIGRSALLRSPYARPTRRSTATRRSGRIAPTDATAAAFDTRRRRPPRAHADHRVPARPNAPGRKPGRRTVERAAERPSPMTRKGPLTCTYRWWGEHESPSTGIAGPRAGAVRAEVTPACAQPPTRRDPSSGAGSRPRRPRAAVRIAAHEPSSHTRNGANSRYESSAPALGCSLRGGCTLDTVVSRCTVAVRCSCGTLEGPLAVREEEGSGPRRMTGPGPFACHGGGGSSTSSTPHSL